MGYSKIYNIEKSLLPNIVHYFNQIPEGLVNGHMHCCPIRHPGAIYNIAYHEFNICFSNTLDNMERLITAQSNEYSWDSLLLAQKYLYNEVCSFYDECYIILKALCTPTPSNSNPSFAYDWLNQNGFSSGGAFKSSTHHLVESYQKINNKLKHNNQRLTGISMKGKDSNLFIPGYIVEGVVPGGAIGPDLEVHTSKNSVGYSFSLTLKNIYFLIHNISDKLLEVIKNDLKSRFSFEFKPATTQQKHDKVTESNWTRLCCLPDIYFPGEYNNQMTVFQQDSNLFKILYPKRLKHSFNEQMTITVQYSGDGYSKNFKIA